MDRPDVEDWVALALVPGLGPRLAREAVERFGGPDRVAYRVPADELRRLAPRLSLDNLREARRSLARRAAFEVGAAVRHGVRLLACVDPDYPAALLELPDPPLVLWLRGELAPGRTRVAVVGSRTPTAYGRRVAAGLAASLAARGVEIVSGGARGIDTLAHRAALDEEGATVAVLGSGLLRPYPEENAALFDAIAAKGAVISEFPLETEPKPGHFPRRNRLISGLSAGIVVVEAAERSGTLSTAAQALDQGREVFAVPGPISSLKSVGCHRLIQQGAKLVHELKDILDELPPLSLGGIQAGEDRGEPVRLEGISPDEAGVLGILESTEPVHLEHLAGLVPFGIARLQTALFGLQVRGAVEQCPGGYYVLRPQKEP